MSGPKHTSGQHSWSLKSKTRTKGLFVALILLEMFFHDSGPGAECVKRLAGMGVRSEDVPFAEWRGWRMCLLLSQAMFLICWPSGSMEGI